MQVEAEATSMKKYQVQRDWRQSLCALITDGRVVLGCYIHPEHNGHSMTATGHYTLAGPDGKVDPQSAGFLEVLYFVWASEVNHCPQLSGLVLRECPCCSTRHARRPTIELSLGLGLEEDSEACVCQLQAIARSDNSNRGSSKVSTEKYSPSSQRMAIRANVAALYKRLSVSGRILSLTTSSGGSHAVMLSEKLGAQTFACFTDFEIKQMIIRMSLPEQLLRRATEADLYAFSQVISCSCHHPCVPLAVCTSDCR